MSPAKPAQRRHLVTTVFLLLAPLGADGYAQSDLPNAPVLSVETEVVLLPSRPGSRSAMTSPAPRLIFDGRPVEIADLRPVSTAGRGDWRFVIYVDPALATPSGIELGVDSLRRAVDQLVALGSVEVVVADPFVEPWLAASRDRGEILAVLAEVDALADSAGEILAIRQEVVATRHADQADRQGAEAIWSEELERLESGRLELMRWLSQERAGTPACLFLLQDGFDPGDRFVTSLGLDIDDQLQRLFEQGSQNQRQLAVTLATAGWTVVPLAMGPVDAALLPDREDALTELAQSSGGEVISDHAALVALLARLPEAGVARLRLEGAADGLPRRFGVHDEIPGLELRLPRWLTIGTPITLTEIRSIRTLEEPDLVFGPWTATAQLRADPAGASSDSATDAILEALIELESPVPKGPVFRVTVMLIELDGPPQIAHFIAAPTDLDTADAWLYRHRLTVSESLAGGAVLIEELTTGNWGSAPLELADQPISTRGLEVATWEASPPVPDRRRATAAPVGEELAVIRVLPPQKRPVVGNTRFQTLVSSPIIARVEFLLDGNVAASDDKAPFAAVLDLGAEVAMHTVEAVAYASGGARLGSHRLVVNPRDDSFQVRITDVSLQVGGLYRITADVRVPAEGKLDRVEFFWNETLVQTQSAGPFSIELPVPDPGVQALVRVAAFLEDGSWIDDAQLLGEGAISERVEVNLVELHLIVTDRSGKPVEGLGEEDFTVRLGRDEMQIQRLGFAEEVPLTLGVVIDTSESMWPLMVDTQQAGSQFVANTLTEQDRAFLVDFDTQPRLAQDTTGDLMQLLKTFSRLQADGYTALYDAVIFSMLQFEATDGRKALVLLTDGDDVKSRYGPRRCIEYGKRLGVPVYIISLAGVHNSQRNLRRVDLEGITEGTGGQVFYIKAMSELKAAYDTINRELRSQYILTFATERELSELELEQIEVRVEDKSLTLRGVVGGQSVE